jgi:hypothetical protein
MILRVSGQSLRLCWKLCSHALGLLDATTGVDRDGEPELGESLVPLDISARRMLQAGGW